MRHQVLQSTSGVDFPQVENTLSVFAYSDYRVYLREYFGQKKRLQPRYSASLFTRKAGLGLNSRGYLKLVIEGKRNLSPTTIRSFSDALGHDPKESLYFENLVLFNQADRPADKRYYFERLVATAQENAYRPLVLLQQHYAYYSNWYYVAIRELVALEDFIEDPLWISHRLLGAVKKDEIKKAIEDLLALGLVTREPGGRLVQSKTLVKAPDQGFEGVLKTFHQQMLERIKSGLDDERVPSEAFGLTLSCREQDFELITQEVKRFRSELNAKFGQHVAGINAVIHLGFQVAQLTSKKKSIKGDMS